MTEVGVPLAKRHVGSIVHAFVRALALVALVVVIGAIDLVLGRAMQIESRDALVGGAIAMTTWLAAGVSFLIGDRVSARDQVIREACSEALGLAADLARVPSDAASTAATSLDARLAAAGWKDPLAALERLEPVPAEIFPLVLSRVRAEMVRAPDRRERLEDTSSFLVGEKLESRERERSSR